MKKRQPEIQAVFTTGLDSLDPDRELLLRGLQTQGIWLQLLNIAEENAFTRQRRRVEVLAGPDEVVGSFERGPQQPGWRPRRCAGSWPWRASAR
jgi:hypothetical protein